MILLLSQPGISVCMFEQIELNTDSAATLALVFHCDVLSWKCSLRLLWMHVCSLG